MASVIKWVTLDPANENAVEAGDRVSVEAGGMPIFHVLKVEDGQVWVGDERHQGVMLQPLQAFHWKAEAV